MSLPLSSQDDEEEDEEVVYELSPFEVSGPSTGGYRATSTLSATRIRTKLGATVGGAQDIRYLRNLIDEGIIPSPASFTAEGLFSEHDLPIGGDAKEGWLFDIASQATSFESAAQPKVDILAQLGFVSGIDATTFKPAPLNLVAVVDKSGSMSGDPLELVRKSLRQVVSQLGSDDQLSIVLYGSSTHIHLEPTKTSTENRDQIIASIDRIQSHGSTAMEAGLELGYQVARQSADAFVGKTRVMLFTDERPNVGRTDATGFMAMAESGSKSDIGLTTIGVGVHFGAELAEKISSVRGGNLFFFDDDESMETTFRKELDTMVLELAYDMSLKVTPAEGFFLSGLYGIPGDAVTWADDGSLSLEIATLFASRNKGAIYLGFDRTAQATESLPHTSLIATAEISYQQADNNLTRQSSLPIFLTPKRDLQEGIIKGQYLVDQYASMKLAALLYESGEYQSAAQIAKTFARKSLPFPDKKLEIERKLASELAQQLAKDCKSRGLSLADSPQTRASQANILEGEWIEADSGFLDSPREILRFTKNQTVELFSTTDENPLTFISESEFSLNKRSILFENWGRTLRYRLKGAILSLREGDITTNYIRKSGLAAAEETTLMKRLQDSVGGLPDQEEIALLSRS
ncbi:von Willebrand factor type A domain protein [Verrucomicrobiia bacterium DG1235]|nr:von Willebrand factor type A domain protein [Verrucomicrobiae bacterium DG1235]